jgi:hypothetical protein
VLFDESIARMTYLTGELALSGPAPRVDPARLPLRGDLAHIKLAGRWFVPHYVVPVMLRATAGGAALRALADARAAPIAALAAEEGFHALEIANGWAWGQVDDGPGGDGLVGYVAMSELARP